jgi:chemotaxis-related protein WspD
MTADAAETRNSTDCWNRIGIAGDRSCPELEKHIHCRNCPVFEDAARGFFDRVPPDGYLADWSTVLAAPVSPADSKDQSVLIFRLGTEWLALPTACVVEVTSQRPIHHIPHRSGDILIGLVNLRGQLQLQVSLAGLLGTERPAPGGEKPSARLVVMRRAGQTWVFEADEVVGVRRFARARLAGVPSTLANPDSSFSQAVIAWEKKSIALLDDQRVFEALKGLTP